MSGAGRSISGAATADIAYSLKRVQELLGLSRTTIAGLIAAGFVTPGRGARNAHRFSFQDLMLLRTAFALQQADIPPRRILRSLARLKAELPDSLPLTGLRITAIGPDVAVRDRSGRWEADSGQLLMDFEVAAEPGGVTILQREAPTGAPPAATDWFHEGAALEATDLAAAEAAYRRAIEADPSRPDPYLNLGALLCEAGRCDEAIALYEQAPATVGDDAGMQFNRAIALEDLGRHDEAIVAYERALAIDAGFADAHYNLGVLLERHGDPQGALRHFSAYRRLERVGE